MAMAGLRTCSSIFSLALVAQATGCATPVLSKDGQLVFQQPGAHGASVITANGVEFLDRNEVPRPIVRRSIDEPWRPATGFLMPSDGVWRQTATPVAVEGKGLAVVLRSSDVLIPSWGGEILLRMDAIAPVAAFPYAAASIRKPERLVIVVDGAGPDTTALATIALDNLGGTDRAGVIDAGGGHLQSPGVRAVLPLIPGSHHTLLHAAVERLVSQRDPAHPELPAARDLPGALAMARQWISGWAADKSATPHVLVLTDGVGPARGGARLTQEVSDLAAAGIEVTAVATDRIDPGMLTVLGAPRSAAGLLDERKDAVDRAVPPPGDVVLDDVRLSTSSVPAPARMIEVSGGDAALGLYADHLSLGQVYAGEARTEVARVVLPPWVPGEPLDLTVTARYFVVKTNTLETAYATIRCRYSDDVEEISRARHGDVIAYASALAMVRRLHRAFLGSELDRPGGVRRLATMQATTLADLARVHHDRALATQAEMLTTLLAVIED
jgi:hypothetical protein